MSNERFETVWDAIEDIPAEAEIMKSRSKLMIALKERIAVYKPRRKESLAKNRAASRILLFPAPTPTIWPWRIRHPILVACGRCWGRPTPGRRISPSSGCWATPPG